MPTSDVIRLIIATKLASAWNTAKEALVSSLANAFATPVAVRATVA